MDREDRVLINLTTRQLAILAITGLVLYGAWWVTRTVVPLAVFGGVAAPVALAVAVVALGQRDGVSLDRLALAALGQRLTPRRRIAAPEGVRPAPAWLATRATHADTGSVSAAPLRLPAEGVTETGVIDLGGDGLAVVAAASTVSFALRTPGEQDALVAVFARFLHSLTAPIQVLIRAERLDLSGQIRELRERAPGLAHPALEAAAGEHADYLAHLAEQTDLLRRQVLLILREPARTAGPAGIGEPTPAVGLPRRRRADREHAQSEADRRAAEARLVRRVDEAITLLAPAGITVTPLDAGAATAVLAAACNPDTLLPPGSGLAGADEVITTPATDHHDDQAVPRWHHHNDDHDPGRGDIDDDSALNEDDELDEFDEDSDGEFEETLSSGRRRR